MNYDSNNVKCVTGSYSDIQTITGIHVVSVLISFIMMQDTGMYVFILYTYKLQKHATEKLKILKIQTQ